MHGTEEAELKAGQDRAQPRQPGKDQTANYINRESISAVGQAGGRFGQAVDDAVLDHIFQYHAPSGNQLSAYANVRAAARAFAKVVLINTPPGSDQTAAIRRIREAVMTANAAIALDGFSI